MMRKNMLYMEDVCKNCVSLVLSNFTIEISFFNFGFKTLRDVNCRTSIGKLFHNTLALYNI